MHMGLHTAPRAAHLVGESKSAAAFSVTVPPCFQTALLSISSWEPHILAFSPLWGKVQRRLGKGSEACPSHIRHLHLEDVKVSLGSCVQGGAADAGNLSGLKADSDVHLLSLLVRVSQLGTNLHMPRKRNCIRQVVDTSVEYFS